MYTEIIPGTSVIKTHSGKLSKSLPSISTVLCVLEDEVQSDPSAKCFITMLKLRLLTAHIFSQYLCPRALEVAVFSLKQCKKVWLLGRKYHFQKACIFFIQLSNSTGSYHIGFDEFLVQNTFRTNKMLKWQKPFT